MDVRAFFLQGETLDMRLQWRLLDHGLVVRDTGLVFGLQERDPDLRRILEAFGDQIVANLSGTRIGHRTIQNGSRVFFIALSL